MFLSKNIIFFLIIISTLFSAITEQKERYVRAFILWSVSSLKYLNWKVEIDELIIFMSSLCNLLAEIGFDITFLYYKIFSYSLANEKMFCKFVKIIRRFCFNRCFKGLFSTCVKKRKIRDLSRPVLEIPEWGINGTKCNWNSRKGIV